MELRIDHLTKSYNKHIVLNDINYSFNSGKIYGLLGRNGAGKTTLFNSIDDDIKVDSGKFFLDGKVLSVSDVGYVMSDDVVPEFLTGGEFIKFYLDINKDRIKDIKSIDYYFNLVDLSINDEDILLKEYSHGMKNKIQILISIITSPKVLLLDEPLTSLDVIAQNDMERLLKSLKRERIIILSTHIVELASSLCDEIVLLNNGHLSSTDNSYDSILKGLE